MGASVRAFIDTNVLVYLLSHDERKAGIAESLLTHPDLERVISTQVINEFVSTARRKARLGWPKIRAFLRLFRASCQVEQFGSDDQDLAIAVAEEFGFQWYDSLIVATALRADVSLLLSEDMHDGQRIDALKITDPFRRKCRRN
jgi:predicted nucleic acid-binding protein